MKMVHIKCRNSVYPFSKIVRFTVTDLQVPWSFEWKEYEPPIYNSEGLKNKPWADPDICKFTQKS